MCQQYGCKTKSHAKTQIEQHERDTGYDIRI